LSALEVNLRPHWSQKGDAKDTLSKTYHRIFYRGVAAQDQAAVLCSDSASAHKTA